MAHYGSSILMTGIQTTTHHNIAKSVANNTANHNYIILVLDKNIQ